MVSTQMSTIESVKDTPNRILAYCQLYANENDIRPKHLSAPVFQMRLIFVQQQCNVAQQMFLGIWEQRNDILHDNKIGSSITQMNDEIRHIYKYALGAIRMRKERPSSARDSRGVQPVVFESRSRVSQSSSSRAGEPAPL